MKNDNPISKHSNCLTLIRLIAALQVAFGHMVEHLELPFPSGIVQAFSFFRGVPIFFAISGFLVWGSIKRSKDFPNYIGKRFLRIYPELWVAVFIELVVIICLYHDNIQWGGGFPYLH